MEARATMDSCSICSLMALAAIAIPATGAYLLRARRQKKLLEESDQARCALCEQPVLEERGTYVCGFCRFDSGWAEDPQVARWMEHLRDSRYAEGLFHTAADKLAVAAARHGRGKPISAEDLEVANSAIIEAQTLLDRVAADQPGLLDGVDLGGSYQAKAQGCSTMSRRLVAAERAYKNKIFALEG